MIINIDLQCLGQKPKHDLSRKILALQKEMEGMKGFPRAAGKKVEQPTTETKEEEEEKKEETPVTHGKETNYWRYH
jgi:hypothetical protein